MCVTPECVTASAAIIESIDEGVDPCEDFYSFACNGWIERHQIPKGQSSWSVTDQRSEDNFELLRNLLEQPLDHRWPVGPLFTRILTGPYRPTREEFSNDSLGHKE